MVGKSKDTPPDDASNPPSDGRRSLFGGRRSLRSPNEALQPDNVPQPPAALRRERRRPIVAIASGILSFVGIAAIALVVVWSLGMQRMRAPGPLAADKMVTIKPYTESFEMADQLATEGVIESPWLMKAVLRLRQSKARSGEYLFKQSASLEDVIDTLVSGKQVLHSITIPEGLTTQQVIDRLREDDVLAGDIKEIPREGTLMPDTYKFARNTDRNQLLRTMANEQKSTLGEIWARRSADTPIRSPYDLVKLASIVEKETGRADERPRVAGVFVNRLTRNMPLQSDPTVVYGLVGGKGTLGRGILKSELEQKTPYNTYAVTGLPPGPIANPGKAALEAVANPSRTKDLYFVADGTGGHAFADNLDQHRANVLRWRQLEKDAKDKVAPDAEKPVVPGPTPAPGQRGDAGPDTLFGAIGGFASTGSSNGPPSPSRIAAFPLLGFNSTSIPFSNPRPSGKGAPGYTSTSDFDELDIEVAGVKTKPGPDDAGVDGGEAYAEIGPAQGAASPSGSYATFPVSPQQIADQKARALAYGLQPSAGELPTSRAEGGPALSDPNARQFGRARIVDASEGTSFDPLRDRSYDLNSGKTVPIIKPLPPVLPLASPRR